MARTVTTGDVEAEFIGGLFLSAGRSGRGAIEKNRLAVFPEVENAMGVDMRSCL
jgi:hypothetical protein